MKIFGGFLIIFSSILSAYTYEKQQKKCINDLKELKEFIEYIKNQIEYFSYPLKTIFKNYNTSNSLLINIMNGNSLKFSDKGLNLEIEKCFMSLGKGYKKEQLEQLEYMLLLIENKIKTYEQEYDKKIKVFRALSLFIGCCIVILLV